MKKYAISDTIQGREIRAARRRLRLTQAEFAELVHVSKKQLRDGSPVLKKLPDRLLPFSIL